MVGIVSAVSDVVDTDGHFPTYSSSSPVVGEYNSFDERVREIRQRKKPALKKVGEGFGEELDAI